MTAIAFGSIFAVSMVAVLWAVKKMPSGCWGNCRQGRDQCNQLCKDKNADCQ